MGRNDCSKCGAFMIFPDAHKCYLKWEYCHADYGFEGRFVHAQDDRKAAEEAAELCRVDEEPVVRGDYPYAVAGVVHEPPEVVGAYVSQAQVRVLLARYCGIDCEYSTGK